VHLNLTNPSKGGRAFTKMQTCGLLLACCAHVPVHPSAEVKLALLRQFSIPVSSIVTLVVFRGLISNNLGAGPG
jgi:hypothetical protein